MLLRIQGQQKTPVLRNLPYHVRTAAFSPDEQLLVTGDIQGRFCVWSTQTGQLRYATPRYKPVKGQPSADVDKVAMSPDKRLIATTDASHTVSLWNAATGGRIRVLPPVRTEVRVLSFSPAGTVLASGYGGSIALWDTRTGTLLRTLTLSRKMVKVLAWSPDGDALASGYEDGTLARWRIK